MWGQLQELLPQRLGHCVHASPLRSLRVRSGVLVVDVWQPRAVDLRVLTAPLMLQVHGSTRWSAWAEAVYLHQFAVVAHTRQYRDA